MKNSESLEFNNEIGNIIDNYLKITDIIKIDEESYLYEIYNSKDNNICLTTHDLRKTNPDLLLDYYESNMLTKKEMEEYYNN